MINGKITDRTGRSWYNKSVIALISEKASGSETPPETIRRLARELVIGAKTVGWEGPPFDPEALADMEGIEVRGAMVDLQAEARILSLPNRRLLIEYAAGSPETRRRFSICHEICHTFFPDCFEQIQHRRGQSKFDRVHPELERLCHIGAGELLMPFEEFVAAANGRMLGIESAEALAGIFNVSLEASLRRMVDLTTKSCSVVWLSERLKPVEQRASSPEFDFGFAPVQPKLRVDFHFSSPTWSAFLPSHKSIPASSILYRVAKGERHEGIVEDWSGLGCGAVRIEGRESLHEGDRKRAVMALIQAP